MIGLVLIILAGVTVWIAYKRFEQQIKEDVTSPKASAKLKRLWNFVSIALQEQRYRAAERALLGILRIDHKNTAAYNRLGMLYAMQENYDDAIECFDIASSLTPTLATLYNLGLVQFENGNFAQAANAFEKVVDLEPTPKRYIAYAKALERLGNNKKVVDVLEHTVEIDPSLKHMELLAQAYERTKKFEKAEALRTKMAKKRSRAKIANRKTATA